MALDDFIKALEETGDDETRCRSCGCLLHSSVATVRNIEYTTYYCDNPECLEFRRPTEKVRTS